jgi:hypothetical protein
VIKLLGVTRTSAVSKPRTTNTATIITYAVKEEEVITTDWTSRVVLGIIFTCTVFMLLNVLTVTVYYFSIHKTVTVKKGLPVMSDQPNPDNASK